MGEGFEGQDARLLERDGGIADFLPGIGRLAELSFLGKLDTALRLVANSPMGWDPL